MKITEALSNVITEAGGTPTAEDAESVTHALGTLYTTLGGTDELPNDVAERINSLSDHIGGGGGDMGQYAGKLFKVKPRTEQVLSASINAPFVASVEQGDMTFYGKWIIYVQVNSLYLSANVSGITEEHKTALAKKILETDGTLGTNAPDLRFRVIYDYMDSVERNAFDQVFEEVTE